MTETPVGITLDGRVIVRIEMTNAELLAALEKETQNERVCRNSEEHHDHSLSCRDDDHGKQDGEDERRTFRENQRAL